MIAALAPGPPPPLAPQDLADSKRINANVKSVPNTATPLRRRRSLVSCAARRSRTGCTTRGTHMPAALVPSSIGGLGRHE